MRLPGFRPGKAPAGVVKKKFADEIQQEALESLMRDAYQSVLESEKLEPVTQPHAHDVKFEEGQPLTFELHCEVKPVIELARLAGFQVTRPSKVTDRDGDGTRSASSATSAPPGRRSRRSRARATW